MRLEDVREDCRYYAGQANAILRNLALAGLGAIWIFRPEAGGGIELPGKLLWAGALFIVSLIADLFVYVGGKRVFTSHLVEVEKQVRRDSGNDELDLTAKVAPYNTKQMAALDWAYGVKATTVPVAYVLVLWHVITLL